MEIGGDPKYADAAGQKAEQRPPDKAELQTESLPAGSLHQLGGMIQAFLPGELRVVYQDIAAQTIAVGLPILIFNKTL